MHIPTLALQVGKLPQHNAEACCAAITAKQKELLLGLGMDKDVVDKMSQPGQGAALLEQAVCRGNVLIVLDDLWVVDDNVSMLEQLLPAKVSKACSSAGSWIVVTTRHSPIVSRILGSQAYWTQPVSASC
jgi:hypothetical protein